MGLSAFLNKCKVNKWYKDVRRKGGNISSNHFVFTKMLNAEITVFNN